VEQVGLRRKTRRERSELLHLRYGARIGITQVVTRGIDQDEKSRNSEAMMQHVVSSPDWT